MAKKPDIIGYIDANGKFTEGVTSVNEKKVSPSMSKQVNPTIREPQKVNVSATVKNLYNVAKGISTGQIVKDVVKNVITNPTVYKTAGNIATNMGEGALRTGESVLDTLNDISDAINNPLTYQGTKALYGKQVAEKGLKESEKKQQEFIKRNLIDEMNKATGWDEYKKNWEEGSLVKSGNFGGQVAQGVGAMVPSLLAGQYLGFAPNLESTKGLTGLAKAKTIASNVGKSYLSQLPSNALFASSSYGSGLQDALNDGATRDKARLYGLTNAAIEQGTEYLTGGIPGLQGTGGIDQVVDPLINRNTNGLLNAGLKAGYGALGEGFEEWAGTYLDALAKQGILGKNINWDEVNKEALQAGLLGSATGAILNGEQTLQNISDVKNENRVRNVLGDAEYAEGSSQYNPDYKGWEAQREENRVAREEKAVQDKARREEFNRIQEERAQEEARKAQEMAQERQKEQERINELNRQERAQEGRKTQDIKTFEDIREDYRDYYKKADMDNFDNTLLNQAKEIIPGNRYGRTKQEWLDIANFMGQQMQGQDLNTIKKYAFESFKDQSPNRNFNKQGKGTDMWGIHDWVRSFYDGAKVNVAEKIQEPVLRIDTKTQQQIDNFKEHGGKVLDSVPVGWTKIEGAQTAPKGYTWYSNGKSRFGGEYENALVKDSTINQIEQIQESPNIEETATNEENKFTGDEGKEYFKELGADEKVAEILSEKPKEVKKGLKENAKNTWRDFRRSFVSKGETIERISKETKNANLNNMYDRLGITKGEAQEHIGNMQRNLDLKPYNNFTDASGEKTTMSLNQIREDAKTHGITEQTLNEYLANYLNVDRYKQGKPVFGDSYTTEMSQEKIAEIESKHPEIKRIANNVWTFEQNQLQNMVDSGLISEQFANELKERNPHYVRIQRDVKGLSNNQKIKENGKNIQVNRQIDTAKGGNQNILPIMESIAQYTEQVLQSERTNLFGQELLKTLGMGTENNSISPITDEESFGVNPELLKDNGDGSYSMTIFNNGVATVVPINKGIYESLTPNKTVQALEGNELFQKIAYPPKKVSEMFRNLTTEKNPIFMFTNAFKDIGDAPFNSKYTKEFAKTYLSTEALRQVAGNGVYNQLYEAAGGKQNSYFNNGEFVDKTKTTGKKIAEKILGPIEKGNEIVESVPRMAEFIATIKANGYEVNTNGELVVKNKNKANKTANEVLNEALYNAAEVTTNFKRGGDVTKMLNRNGATFLNASVQGFDKQIRNFTDIQSPKQAVMLLTKALIFGIAPTMLNDAMHDDDDEYKDLQEYQKDNYYLFKGKDGQWIRIPKGRAMSVIGSAFRRLKSLSQGDTEAFKGFGKFAANQVAPNSVFSNNIFAPLSQVKQNESWSGNKIISDSMSKKPTEEQYNEKTDEISKFLGKAIKDLPLPEEYKNFKSPLAIHYLLDQYSGAIGDVILPMITDKSSSKYNSLVAPFISKFTADSVYSSKNVSDYYDKKTQIETQKNSEKATPIDVAKNSYMTSQNIQMSDLYKQQRDIQSNKSLSKEEKYDKAREVQKEINKKAKQIVEDIDNIEENEYYLKIGDYYYKKVMEDGEVKYKRDTSKKIPTEKYALYDYFKQKFEDSKEESKG